MATCIYGKARALDRTELWRLRLSVRLETALRRRIPAPFPPSDSRYDQILTFLRHPQPRTGSDCLEWILCHASPRLLRRLIATLERTEPQPDRLGIVQRMDPQRLLPREHIVPDYQFVTRVPRPRTVLVCLTGNALRLNMPLQLFHALVGDGFDAVIYLRDERRLRFLRGVPGLGDSIDAVGQRLTGWLPAGCRIAILATSSGGVAALPLMRSIGAARVAMFSPEFRFEGTHALDGAPSLSAARARLYFARDHAPDLELSLGWESGPLAQSIQWVNSGSHGTLADLVSQGGFAQLLRWLAAADRPEQDRA